MKILGTTAVASIFALSLTAAPVLAQTTTQEPASPPAMQEPMQPTTPGADTGTTGAGPTVPDERDRDQNVDGPGAGPSGSSGGGAAGSGAGGGSSDSN